jgi:hypothetical protein
MQLALTRAYMLLREEEQAHAGVLLSRLQQQTEQ